MAVNPNLQQQPVAIDPATGRPLRQNKGYYSQDTLKNMLDLYNKRSELIGAGAENKDWQNFAPQELNFEVKKNPYTEQMRQQILANSNAATQLEQQKAQVRAEQKAYADAQKQLQQAQSGYIGPSAAAGGPAGAYSGTFKDIDGDGIPEVSDLGNLSRYASTGAGSMATVRAGGLSFTVNRAAAPIFQAFVNDLVSQGYKPASIGGYNVRNIAGSNRPSLHSYGFAIDIDPGKNPVTYNGRNITALPPNIAALAAKYGLTWGGSWSGAKRDPMHFSIAYGGTK